jgi:hypothetical protein
MSSARNKPLRGGVHLMFNDALLEWIQARLAQVAFEYGDEREGIDVLQGLEKTVGWTRVDDNFGKKVFCSTPFPCGTGSDGELRIGVVLKKDGTFNLDVRPWGEY